MTIAPAPLAGHLDVAAREVGGAAGSHEVPVRRIATDGKKARAVKKGTFSGTPVSLRISTLDESISTLDERYTP
jgi:hypothetical protein